LQPELVGCDLEDMAELYGRRIGVVGGGIGGLAATAALQRIGVDAVVFEASSHRSARGALLLWANAVRALATIGPDLAPTEASEIESTEIRTSRGDVLSTLPIRAWSRRSGAPSVVIRRPWLIELLERALIPGTLQRGRRVAKFSQVGDRIDVQFDDGSIERVDGLIGADGLSSMVRAQLLGARPPRPTGQEAWVGVAPFQPPGVVPGVSVAAVGIGPRFWFAPLAGGATFWYATRAQRGAPPSDRDAHASSDHGSGVLQTFRDWCSPIPALIAATCEDEIAYTRIRDHAPVPRWGASAVSLLGDAAHPCTPDLGQGACQAIESAVALRDALRDTWSIPDAFRAYERRRMQRTATIARLSWMTATNSTVQDPGLCRLRDAAIRAALTPVARYHLTWILGG
jgi:2-polyprenyl-6-methoxyphenol hydroxylase-like FAD-dependent oxidoreductase